MARYTYECDRCGRVFDVSQRITEEPLRTCQDCAGAVHRIIYPPTLSFQGSGWTVKGAT